MLSVTEAGTAVRAGGSTDLGVEVFSGTGTETAIGVGIGASLGVSDSTN